MNEQMKKQIKDAAREHVGGVGLNYAKAQRFDDFLAGAEFAFRLGRAEAFEAVTRALQYLEKAKEESK